MAAVQNQSSRQHPQSRLRTSSDPFGDPAPRSKMKPPPPPPKTSSATRIPVALPKSGPADLTEAVRDTVTVHQQDNNPRHKGGNRSQTMGLVFFFHFFVYIECLLSFHSGPFPTTLDHPPDDLNPTTLPMPQKDLTSQNDASKKVHNMQM